jgi:hypothetical protein
MHCKLLKSVMISLRIIVFEISITFPPRLSHLLLLFFVLLVVPDWQPLAQAFYAGCGTFR